MVDFVQRYVTEADYSGGMDMVLRSNMRGHGIGTRVVHAIVQHARDTLGRSHLVLGPQIDNQRGVNFWCNVVFEPQGVVGDDHDQHWHMTWDLHRPDRRGIAGRKHPEPTPHIAPTQRAHALVEESALSALR